MKSIENALQKYFFSTGKKVPVQEINIYAKEHGNELVNTLFKILDGKLDSFQEEQDIDKIKQIYIYLEIINISAEGLNRKKISQKINKVYRKLGNLLKSENLKDHKKGKSTISDIKELENATKKLESANCKPNSKQYELIKYLISETRNLSYVEFTFKKMPKLVNVKDNCGMSLFYNIGRKIIKEDNLEKLLYYVNLLSLIRQQKSFVLSSKEKKHY